MFAERWEGAGFTMANAMDPEGNVFQVRESLARSAALGITLEDRVMIRSRELPYRAVAVGDVDRAFVPDALDATFYVATIKPCASPATQRNATRRCGSAGWT